MVWGYLRDIIPATLERLGLSEKLEDQKTLEVWDEIISPINKTIARRSRAIALHKDTIFIAASDSITATELQLMQQSLLEAFRHRFPDRDIRHIRVVFEPRRASRFKRRNEAKH